MTITLSLPPSDWFSLPPLRNPPPLAPPPYPASPFTIPPSFFLAALDISVPITIASTYFLSVFLLNAYNARNGYKPWGITRSPLFKPLVLLHNIFLAVYSGWTFYSITVAYFSRSLNTSQGALGIIDSLCHFHGPPTLSRASLFSPSTLSYSSLPSSAIPGRLWNEGLGFFGFLFYLSKFYEVIDTLVILAKGKKSSTLQTYHHAGAMFCMWAGIRYMSPPIWMFVFVNSFIHTLMYTYYTLSSLSLPIPRALKRSLTTLQIAQFLWGASYAALHLFLSHSVPSSPSSLDKLLHRGQGGKAGEKMIRCLDNSGEAFAVWLNVLYLAPLTWLFGRFFVRSYLGGGVKKGGKAVGNGKVVGNGKKVGKKDL